MVDKHNKGSFVSLDKKEQNKEKLIILKKQFKKNMKSKLPRMLEPYDNLISIVIFCWSLTVSKISNFKDIIFSFKYIRSKNTLVG